MAFGVDIKKLKANSGQNTNSSASNTQTNSITSSNNPLSQSTGSSLVEEAKNKSTKEQVGIFNKHACEQNKKDTEDIHGLTDEAYAELRRRLKGYGIDYDEKWKTHSVAQTAAKQIGKTWCYDMIAESYDSVLDLVIDEKLQLALQEINDRKIASQGGKGNGFIRNWEYIVGHYGNTLRKYGLVLEQSGKGNFWISMVDKDGNVIQDENGKLAQHKVTDAILPDGVAQNVELHCSALVDAMGYDMISVLDFTEEEYQIIKEMAKLDASELGESSGEKAGHGGYASHYSGAAQKDVSSWLQMRSEYNKGFSETYSYSESVDGELSNSNSSIYYHSDGRLKTNHEILVGAQAALNEFVDDLLKDNNNMTIEEATAKGNDRLQIRHLNLRYTGYNHNNNKTNSVNTPKKTEEITTLQDAQNKLNKNVEEMLRNNSTLSINEATKKAIELLNLYRYHLKYTGSIEQEEE